MESTDRGYAWVVPFACCFINAILFGGYRTYGLLFRVLLETFPVSRATASWPFSLCMTVIHLTGPISGALNSYFSVKSIMFVGCLLASLGTGLCYWASSAYEITLFVGIIQGFGIGLTYVQNPVIINQHFVKFRASANGIALSGGTLGSFVLCFLMEKAIGVINLQECFLLLSMAILLTLPVCLLLKEVKDAEEKLKIKQNDIVSSVSTVYLTGYSVDGRNVDVNGANGVSSSASGTESAVMKALRSLGNVLVSTLTIGAKPSLPGCSTNNPEPQEEGNSSILSDMGSILRDPFFILTSLTHMAYFWGSITYTMIIVDYAMDKQIKGGALLINAFAVGDLVGRLGSGWFLDNEVLPLNYLAFIAIGVIGIFLEVTMYCSTFYEFVAISAGLGLMSGLINILLNILFCKYLGTKRAPLAFGLSAFFCGLATLLRPLAVGYFRDSKEGSYDGLFGLLGLLALVSGNLWLLEPLFLKKKNIGGEKEREPQIIVNKSKKGSEKEKIVQVKGG